MMKRINFRRVATIAVVVVLLLAFAWVLSAPAQDTSANRSVALLAPAFVSEASADPAAPANFLVDEAGMSAYMKSPYPIDLATVRDLYRTIEVETPDYIIGSIPISDYPEWMDIHVYVHKDGWIVGYYRDEDPVGKIFDWYEYHRGDRSGITTTLENTVAYVAGEAALPYSGATHYDFRYPNATELMFIIEQVHSNYKGVSDSFQINIPGTFSYYERSWSLYSTTLYVDGANIGAGGLNHGTLTATQLLPDRDHEIKISGAYNNYGGLALVYRRP